MKKTLFTFLLLFAATAMNAQGIVKGDMDGDGEVTITDVMSAVDVILGKAPKQLVKPYNVDNTLIVGTWYAPDWTSFTLNEDGSIKDYPGAATYKFRYYLGTLTMYNASGKAVKVMGVVKVTKSYLLLLDYATGAVAYYTSSAVPNFHNPDDCVDLGLPSGTLWATCNVGASSPEDYGDYFAWGETSAKTTYNWSTYFDTNDDGLTFNKYYDNGGLTELKPEDDAAYVNWGPAWRMPSEEQFEELVNSSYTITEWTTQNGVNGRKITSRANGNSIFLPASGYRGVSSLIAAGSDGMVWSRTLITSSSISAVTLGFSSGGIGPGGSRRSGGHCVRPVRLPEIGAEVSASSLSFASLGGSEQVSINCNGSWTASSSESWCIISPASGTGDGSLTITVSENTSTDSRSATVTVTADALTRTITVTQNGKAAGNTPAGVTAVDLGLPSGTLWANMNVGASSPEDYGDYFAWGETEPYAENGKTTFDWSTYFDTNDNGSTFNKYNNNGGLTELKPEDDAAYVNWGPAWRMPSQEQFEELINSNYTTTEWTTQNGVNGRLIISNSNGNSVFLPAAGARPGSFLFDAGSGGDYWSRTLNSEYPDRAWGLYFHSSSVYTDYGFRYYGFTVRPVRRLPE